MNEFNYWENLLSFYKESDGKDARAKWVDAYARTKEAEAYHLLNLKREEDRALQMQHQWIAGWGFISVAALVAMIIIAVKC